MSASESSSTTPFPQYRLKRKPAPTIDIAEKYPSPDPQDPFAPLWVLRNRTSSALGQNPLVTKDTPSPYAKPSIRTHKGFRTSKTDILKTNYAINSIPIERRRSNSYVFPHSTTNTTDTLPPRSSSTLPQDSNNGPRAVRGLTGPPGTNTTSESLSHQLVQPRHPLANSDDTPRANVMPPTAKPRNDSQLVHPQPRAPGNITRRLTADMRTGTSDNSSGNETESDFSVPAPHRKQWVDVKVKSIDVASQGKTDNAGLTTTISFNVGVNVKPTLLRRAASNGTTSTGSASLARNISSQPMSQQSRLAKFLLPKKTSHDGYMADEEKRSVKLNSRLNQKGPVHKLSISAPLTDTLVHSELGQSKLQELTTRSSSRGGNVSDNDLEEGTGRARFRGVLFRARKKPSTDNTHVSGTSNSALEKTEVVTPGIVAEKSKDKESGKRPEMSWAEVNVDEYYTPITSPRGSYPTPAPSPQLPALELKPEAPVGEEQVKGADQNKGSREQVEKKTESEHGAKGVTTQLKTVGDTVYEATPSETNRVTTQAPRVKRLKTTIPSKSIIPNASVPATAVPSSTPMPPPPPPKIYKRRTSSPTPAQAVIEAASALPHNELPSTHSISNTSIVHVGLISAPKQSDPPVNENEDVGAFVKPRRAPRPPAALGVVEGVQSEPETLNRERFNPFRQEDKKVSRKNGVEIESDLRMKPKSDDEAPIQTRQNLDAVKTTKVPEVDAMPNSRKPISVVKHGKAASTDFRSRKDQRVPAGAGRTDCSDDCRSKKATIPVSMSTPACLSSKGHEGGCLPLSQPQASRSIFHPKDAPSDNSFNAIGGPPTEYSLPTRTQLSKAALLPVYAEDGRGHLFGSLFEKQKTVVIFIRHFWCPLCQDYMSMVKGIVTPDMIVPGGWIKAGAEKDEDEIVWKKDKGRDGTGNSEVERIGLVVISNGAHGMIAKYRQIFSLPFRVYTDSSLAIYKLLGMGKTGTDSQVPQHGHPTHYLSDSPAPSMPKKKRHNYSLRKKADTSLSSLSDKEREQGGGYVKHGLMSGIAMVVVRALKVGMPVWEKGGDVGQLGGEFVLGPGIICTYAHKMQSSKGHAPIEEVLQAAGVKLGTPEPCRPSSPRALSPRLPETSKQEPAYKQTDSIDLSSPPRRSKETREPVRNRKDSLSKGLQETFSSGRTIVTDVTAIKNEQTQRAVQQGERERRNDQSPSPIPTSVINHKIIPPALPPALTAVMTRKEETRWAEERQKSIERAIQDRGNNVRRVGALGRSPSSQGQGAVRSTHGMVGGKVAHPATARDGRSNSKMPESRSAPVVLEDEEMIVYKSDGRRAQEGMRNSDVRHGPGSGYVQKVSTSTKVGYSASTRR